MAATSQGAKAEAKSSWRRGKAGIPSLCSQALMTSFANPASGWPYQSPAWGVLVFVENQGMTLIRLQSPPDCSLITPTERRRHPQRGSRGRMPRPTAWLAQHLAALSGFEESIQGPRQL